MDPDAFDEERRRLRAANYRYGRAAIEIVLAIEKEGVLGAALRAGANHAFSYSTLQDAELIARRAPAHEHLRRITALLAIVAAACEANDRHFAGQFSARQRAQLHYRFLRLSPDQRQWVRDQLHGAGNAQPALFPFPIKPRR